MRQLVDTVNMEMETKKSDRMAALEAYAAGEVEKDIEGSKESDEAGGEVGDNPQESGGDSPQGSGGDEALNDLGRTEFTLHEFISVLDHHTIQNIKVSTAQRTDHKALSVRAASSPTGQGQRSEEKVVTVQKNKVIV